MTKSFISQYLHDVSGIRITQPRALNNGVWSRDIVITLNDTKIELTVFGKTAEAIGYVEDLAPIEAQEVAA
jgi:hypothetical protein